MSDWTFIFDLDVRSIILYFVGGIVAVSIYFLTGRNENRKKTVPYVSSGFIESMKGLTGSEAPFFVLRETRAIQQAGKTCYRSAVPIPGGVYVVIDNNLLQRILKDPSNDKSPVYKPLNALFGTKESLFTSFSNEYWKKVRKSTAHAFANAEVSRMREISIKACNNWCDSAAQKFTETAFSPSHEMVQLTFNIICEAAFEYHATEDEFIAFTENLKLCLIEFLMRQSVDPLRAVVGFLFPECRRATKAAANMRSFTSKILDAYRKNPIKSSQNTLIKILDSNIPSMSDEQRIAEILVYIIAGHDTTGFTVSNNLVLLAMNPDKMFKLRKDAEGLLPVEWSRRSKFFQYILKETFRYVPTTPMGSARTLAKDFVTADDEIIPKGATVMLTQIVPGRNINVFKDPDTYNPDRWYDATPEMNSSMIPFAAGHRNCVGQSLAVTQLETILPIILSRFDMQVVDEGKLDYFVTWKFLGTKLLLKSIEEAKGPD